MTSINFKFFVRLLQSTAKAVVIPFYTQICPQTVKSMQIFRASRNRLRYYWHNKEHIDIVFPIRNVMKKALFHLQR